MNERTDVLVGVTIPIVFPPRSWRKRRQGRSRLQLHHSAQHRFHERSTNILRAGIIEQVDALARVGGQASGTGQASHPIRPLARLQSAVFLINSCSHLVSATLNSSIREGLHRRERTFSRSYGTILPSSFTRVLSSALVFST